MEWVEAFLWAAVMVLLINQYLLQAYQIPSASMVDTLLNGDRIFVNKLVFGPELLPSAFKLPGFQEPERADIIIFENPDYLSRGTGFEVAQRVLYMLTLSLIDIDAGAKHFLIKRMVGDEGDIIHTSQGDVTVQVPGLAGALSEERYRSLFDLEYDTQRLFNSADYQEQFFPAGRALARRSSGRPLSDVDTDALSWLSFVDSNQLIRDNDAILSARATELYRLRPERLDSRTSYWMNRNGRYVPAGRMLPLGDNRDNSADGRSFGAVELDAVLGEAMLRYWPLHRLGGIQ